METIKAKITSRKEVHFLALCSCGLIFQNRDSWKSHLYDHPHNEAIVEWQEKWTFENPTKGIRFDSIGEDEDGKTNN